MSRAPSVRLRLLGIILLVIAPASVLMYLADRYYPRLFIGEIPWPGFVIGMLALGAAWYGGERYILRQLALLSKAAQRVREGDFTARSGLADDETEVGQMARDFDAMAATLEKRGKERELSEKNLLNRSFQQTVVGALGQFALVSRDFDELLNQAAMLVSQTLEVQYCNILELSGDGQIMVLRAGKGWRNGMVGTATFPADPQTQSGFTLTAGEPVVVEDLATETRFRASTLLVDHGVVSGVTVAIRGQGKAYGILGAHSTQKRMFTEDEVHFLLSIAAVLAMAVEQGKSEEQLRQSQKMECVGQLAAGVAHDFNNMLTVIQAHAGILQERRDVTADVADSAQAIYFAAERAASLTKQLLMFSRKNVMQLQMLDLREVVGNMSKMLQRLLGETIQLEFNPPARAPLIQGDAGMIEQVLLNFAVNARDAMPRGGRLVIATELMTIDERYARSHPDARPGMFLCLRVTDTGCGMDAATLSRIFEPFFTTKEVGKGTGLGLATVYGIVKQHDGWVEVASLVGRGTSFSVYFPARGAPKAMQRQQAAPVAEVSGGRETILVVEDEPVLRDLAHMILEERGYTVLEAKSGVEAIEVWTRHAGTVDLVVTDMVMPEGISGMELAERLLPAKPNLKIVFASGYSMDDLDTDFIKEGKALFLQKPYTHVSLAKAVRDCLDTVN